MNKSAKIFLGSLALIGVGYGIYAATRGAEAKKQHPYYKVGDVLYWRQPISPNQFSLWKVKITRLDYVGEIYYFEILELNGQPWDSTGNQYFEKFDQEAFR